MSAVASESRFYSIEQAATVVALSHWTLRKAIKGGDLVAYKIGGVYRIEDIDLRRWLDGQRFQPVEALVVRHARPSRANSDCASGAG
jgi:excisionase family DNA binding protein